MDWLEGIKNHTATIKCEQYDDLVRLAASLDYFGVYKDLKDLGDIGFGGLYLCDDELFKLQLDDWVNNELLYTLVDRLSGHFNQDDIVNIVKRVQLCTSETYQVESKKCDEYKDNLFWIILSNGFYSHSTGKVCVRLNYSNIEESKSTVLHELLHSICNNFEDDKGKYHGLSEAMTEYLAFTLLNRDFNVEHGYKDITDVMKLVFDVCGLTVDDVLDIYLSDNVDSLRNVVDGKVYAGYFNDILLPALNDNILSGMGESLKNAVRILNNIVPNVSIKL